MQANLCELKNAIDSLPEADYTSLRDWFIERDWQAWDRQIEADSESGKFGELIQQAIKEKAAGTLRDL